jgi:transposase
LIEKLTIKYKGRKFLIISDNAGVHQTIPVNKVLQNKHVTTLFIPPYCPKFNGIEIYWAVLKKKVFSYGCIGTLNKIEYKMVIKKAIKDVNNLNHPFRRTFRVMINYLNAYKTSKQN